MGGAAKRFGPRLHDSGGAGRMLQPKASIKPGKSVCGAAQGNLWGQRGSREQGTGNREQDPNCTREMAAYRVVLHSLKGCSSGYKTCEMAAQVVIFRVDMYLAGSLFRCFDCLQLN